MHGFFSKFKSHVKSTGSSDNIHSSKSKNDTPNTQPVTTTFTQSYNPDQVKKESIQIYKTPMGSQVLSKNIVSSNTSSNITFTKIISPKQYNAKIASQPQEDQNNHINDNDLRKIFEPKQATSINKNEISTKNDKITQEIPKKLETKILDLKTINSFTNKENKPYAKKDSELDVELFDPEPVREVKEIFNKITYIDDRTFIDDGLDDEELAHINKQKINKLIKEPSYYTVNEVPEGRLSSFSSRASSRSSESARGSGFISDQQSDLKNSDDKHTNSFSNSETSASDSGIKMDTKNTLLEALIRKLNLGVSDIENKNQISEPKTSSIVKQEFRYSGEDQKKKQSELQKKINRSNLEKNKSTTSSQSSNSTSGSSDVQIKSSSQNDVDQRKVNDNKTKTLLVNHGFSKNQISNSIVVTKLPQSFECKYLGKTPCLGLWGLKHVRDPVDRLVKNAKKVSSLDELPTVETLVSEKGIYIVQRLFSDKNQNLNNKVNNREKHYRSGLLPISNISYATQDNLYNKVFSCIVVREHEQNTISECYSFLCDKNESARKMALSITLAFKEYGKMLQLNETKINRDVKLKMKTINEPNSDSFA